MSFITNLFHAFAAAGSAFILVLTGGSPAQAPAPIEPVQVVATTSVTTSTPTPLLQQVVKTVYVPQPASPPVKEPAPATSTLAPAPTPPVPSCTKSSLIVSADKTTIYAPQTNGGSADPTTFSLDLYPGCDYDIHSPIVVLEDGKLAQNIPILSSAPVSSGKESIPTLTYVFTPTEYLKHATHVTHTFTFRYLTSETKVSIWIAGK